MVVASVLNKGAPMEERRTLLIELARFQMEGATNFSLKASVMAFAPQISFAGVDDNFAHHLAGKNEIQIPPCTIRIQGLAHPIGDARILEEVGNGSEIFLFNLFKMLGFQGRGQKAAPPVLEATGYPNICFIRDVRKMLWTVVASWSEAKDGWVVEAHTGYIYDRPPGSHIISRVG